jgi:hypothetical protein
MFAATPVAARSNDSHRFAATLVEAPLSLMHVKYIHDFCCLLHHIPSYSIIYEDLHMFPLIPGIF